MSEPKPEVLVVGAGPAGSTAAHILARRGHETVLVDRAVFPRDKICGDGLAPRSVQALRELGVETKLVSAGHEPIREYRIMSTWGQPVQAGLPSFGKGVPYTYVVPRRELDRLLVQAAAEAGADVWEGTRALRLVSDAEKPTVECRTLRGRTVLLRPRIVIAADGSRASFTRTVVGSARVEPYAVAMRAYVSQVEGIDDALGFFLDRHLLPGYGWVFPASRAEAPHNVGVGMKVATMRKNGLKPRDLFRWFLGPESSAYPHLRNAELVDPPASFPLLLDFTKGLRRVGAVLVAGDAANLIDPLSGEGMAYAFESGRAAAGAADRALRSGELKDLASYEAGIWKGLSAEFGGAWLLRELLRQPWGNGLMIRFMLRDEAIARGGMGVLSNSVPASWLLRPLVWRRVLKPERVRSVVRGGRPSGG